MDGTPFFSASIRILYLISGPEVLHAGTPTPLAVSVFADFTGSVTAELAHGDTRVAQTVDFQGGETTIMQKFRSDLNIDLTFFFFKLKHHSVFKVSPASSHSLL